MKKCIIILLFSVAAVLSAQEVKKTNLMFGMELVRADINGKKIFQRYLCYPLNKIIVTKYPQMDSSNVYQGTITAPVVMFNPKVKYDFESYYKKRTDREIIYSIRIQPKSKVGNKYICEASIAVRRGDDRGQQYSKNFEIEAGSKIKIELNKIEWKTEILVDGKIIKINSNEDLYKFASEYLIISLENDDQ